MVNLKYIKMTKKSKTRLFISKKLSLNMMVCIKDQQHHFLKNVLRAKINDVIMLFDNKTGEWKSRVISIDRDNSMLKVLEKNREINKEADIWLAFSPIKQHRLNITIQKATELGVTKLIPCKTDYTNNNFLNYKSLDLNIIEAAEQCHRLTLPILEKQITLENLINNHPKDRALIFCNEQDNKGESMFTVILSLKNIYDKWTVLIGPEGGFSEVEIENIKKTPNLVPVSLGKRILRSDTATIAALFCLQSIVEKK